MRLRLLKKNQGQGQRKRIWRKAKGKERERWSEGGKVIMGMLKKETQPRQRRGKWVSSFDGCSRGKWKNL